MAPNRARPCWMLLLTGCALLPAGPPPSSPSALLGRPLPSFRRTALQGVPVASEDLGGQVVVLEFFARFCAPCQRRLPLAQRLQAEAPQLAVIGVSLDDTVDAALDQVRRYRLTFPVLHDAGGALAGRFRVTELPAAVVVGRDGKIAWVGGPEQPEQALRQAALAALKVRAEPTPASAVSARPGP